jgi:hypothetical protein
MRTLEEIRERCVITEDGHWLWRGSLRVDGRANIYAPDYTKGGMSVQSGPRAVWHCHTGQPIPAGFRAYGTCDERACCNPKCIACTSEADFGKWLVKKGKYKGKVRRILANRAILRARSKLTPALIDEIRVSPEAGIVVAQRLGLSPSVVSKVRRGTHKSFQPAGMFSGLGARP